MSNQEPRAMRHFEKSLSVYFWKAYGWMVYRPIRWFFWKMVANSRLTPLISRQWSFDEPKKVFKFTNFHWWILYKTVFKFFKWLYWYAWAKFAIWSEPNARGARWLVSHTWLSKFIQWVGSYTAASVISGGRCRHCGNEEGDPVLLVDSATYFELFDSGVNSTPDGMEGWFSGFTHCPCCHHVTEYHE